MVELRPITADNFIDAFNLRLAPGQERFVSHPIRSLAQAYVYRTVPALGGGPSARHLRGRESGNSAHNGGLRHGDLRLRRARIRHMHMMIDEAEQGRGYGRAALDAIIEYIRTKPFGDSNRVALTCNKDNAIARKLYERMGFSPTAGGGPSAGGRPCDHEDEDETGLAMTVEPAPWR